MDIGQLLKSARQGFSLGWKVESNWTDPWLFSIYSIIRPFAALLIVAFIYIIGSQAGGTVNPEFLAYLLVGNTFFIYAATILLTMGWLLHDDREHYEVFKHIYISPGTIHSYLLGRGLAAASIATVSVVLTLVFGVALFNLPIDPLAINYPLLIASVAVGVPSLIFTGYMLYGVSLISAKLEWALGEYVSGIFFLLAGVIFPPEVLPTWVQPLSNVLPLTYFLRVVRTSMLSPGAPLPASDLLYLVLYSLATAALGLVVFRLAEQRAKKRGLIDMKAVY
ncbi:MAG: ABC transporter permease [Candidatus Geothermarchaeales archaeon]